jgi:nicotinate-nucleotide adenylyltransferase
MSKRLGVYGGTFDPIHMGHLIVAEQGREAGRLDRVLFVPAASPPNKAGQRITRFEQRVEMLELAIAGYPPFAIDQLEKERSGPSYTVDTLEELKRRHPGAQLFLLIGSDSLADLPTWREPARIVANAGLVVMVRPNYPPPSAEQLRTALKLAPEVNLEIILVPTPPLVDIASRDLRRRVAEGRSIRYLVPRAVECYIAEKGLYRDAPVTVELAPP